MNVAHLFKLQSGGGVFICGRYWLSDSLEDIAKKYGVSLLDNQSITGPEIFPSQAAPVIYKVNTPQISLWKWGFPNPVKSGIIINARAETIDQKRMFKRPFAGQRCVIPANAFFEWKKEQKGKQKYRIYFNHGNLFSMAGIWESFTTDDGTSQNYFVIITTRATNRLQAIHDRMPVILTAEEEKNWLDHNNSNIEVLKSILDSPKFDQKMITAKEN